jgi:hypothetical protein
MAETLAKFGLATVLWVSRAVVRLSGKLCGMRLVLDVKHPVGS